MMLGGPKYGYQIKREAAWVTGQKAMHNNLVYPMLRRFLDEGWVSKKAVPGDRGQTRQLYAITSEGRRHLLDRLQEFGADDARSEEAFHLRVGLFAVIKVDVRDAILSRREDYLRGHDKKLAELQVHMDLGKFGGEVVRHMRKQVEIECAWIANLRRMARPGTHKKENQ